MKIQDKKVVLITGASAGIGKATAGYFAEKGWIVYGAARRDFIINGVIALQADVTKRTDLIKVVETIIKQEGKIDLLVNNAGFGISGPAEFSDEKDIKALFDVNFFAAVNLTQLVIPYMRAAGCGKIININSVAGFIPIPYQAFYSASKSALEVYSKALRMELKPYKIKVTNIQPGSIKTEFVDKRKKSTSEVLEIYPRTDKALSKMEKEEINGLDPLTVAKAVYRQAKRKNPPYTTAPRLAMKLLKFVVKILPERVLLWAVRILYG